MSHLLRKSAMMLGILVLAFNAGAAGAAEWYVGPAGKAAAKGRADDPWDIASALAGQQKVAAGDTLWLLEGTYKVPFKSRGRGFPVHLVGTATSPIHVRARDRQMRHHRRRVGYRKGHRLFVGLGPGDHGFGAVNHRHPAPSQHRREAGPISIGPPAG